MGTVTAAMQSPLPHAATPQGDDALVAAARGGDSAAFEAIMRRHNRTMFRTARAILQNEADAEEVVQEAYLKAFLHLAGLAGASRPAPRRVKIAVNAEPEHLRRTRPGSAPNQTAATNQ